MKLQQTCSICLSKIKIIDLRLGSRRMGPKRKLLCGHVFHTTCIANAIIYKPQCPLCEHPIFNKDEEALITCISKEIAIEILQNIHSYDINIKNIFIFLTTHMSAQKYKWLVDIMYKYCDFTDILAENLNNKSLVKDIMKRGNVNWFKTFHGGLTFFDLVYEHTDDPDILEIVHSKLPMDNRSIILPKSTVQLEPEPQPRTATIRRSLRMNHFQEHRLYPNLPTAPPYEDY